jgi:hypothetical protein
MITRVVANTSAAFPRQHHHFFSLSLLLLLDFLGFIFYCPLRREEPKESWSSLNNHGNGTRWPQACVPNGVQLSPPNACRRQWSWAYLRCRNCRGPSVSQRARVCSSGSQGCVSGKLWRQCAYCTYPTHLPCARLFWLACSSSALPAEVIQCRDGHGLAADHLKQLRTSPSPHLWTTINYC